MTNISCEKCKKIFTTAKELKREDRYSCPFCGMQELFMPRLEPITINGILMKKRRHRKDLEKDTEKEEEEKRRRYSRT